MAPDARAPIEKVLEALRQRRLHVVKTGPNQYSACCPAHPDQNPSLSITAADNSRVLVYCRAGCLPDDIVDALGLDLRDLFPAASGRRAPYTPPTPQELEAAEHEHVERWTHRAGQYKNCVAAQKLSNDLDVAYAAADELQVGWHYWQNVWTIPERNGRGEVIGIATRSPDGTKKCLRGGRRGLVLPKSWKKLTGRS
jgi:hypothetical protein